MTNGSKPNGGKLMTKTPLQLGAPSASLSAPQAAQLPTLEELELLIDVLVSTPKGKPLPGKLQTTLDQVLKNRIDASFDHAKTHDRTEQLRLALRLLECNDLAVKQASSSKNKRVREVDL